MTTAARNSVLRRVFVRFVIFFTSLSPLSGCCLQFRVPSILPATNSTRALPSHWSMLGTAEEWLVLRWQVGGELVFVLIFGFCGREREESVGDLYADPCSSHRLGHKIADVMALLSRPFTSVLPWSGWPNHHILGWRDFTYSCGRGWNGQNYVREEEEEVI